MNKKNAILNLLYQLSNFIFPILIFPYVIRIISPEHLGEIFYFDSIVQYLVIFSSFGIPLYGLREISKFKDKPQKVSKICIELLTIQTIFTVFAIIILFVISNLSFAKINQPLLIWIGVINLISNIGLIEWFFQANDDYKFITIRSLFIRLVSFLAIIIFINKNSDYIYYYLILTLMISFASVFNLNRFYKNYIGNYDFKLQLKQHLRPLLFLFFINVFVSMYTVTDTIILGALTNKLNVSYYQVPLKLVKAVWLIISSLGLVFITQISQLSNKGETEKIKSVLQKSLNITFYFGISCGLFCLFFPSQILYIIAGDKYLNSIPTLQILGFLPLIIGICNVYGTQFLLPIGKEKKIMLSTILGFICSITLNIILIPFLHFNGSATACIVSESLVMLSMIYFAKELKLSLNFKILVHLGLSFGICIVTFNYSKTLFSQNLSFIISCTFYVISFLLLNKIIFKERIITEMLNLKPLWKK